MARAFELDKILVPSEISCCNVEQNKDLIQEFHPLAPAVVTEGSYTVINQVISSLEISYHVMCHIQLAGHKMFLQQLT